MKWLQERLRLPAWLMALGNAMLQGPGVPPWAHGRSPQEDEDGRVTPGSGSDPALGQEVR